VSRPNYFETYKNEIITVLSQKSPPVYDVEDLEREYYWLRNELMIPETKRFAQFKNFLKQTDFRFYQFVGATGYVKELCALNTVNEFSLIENLKRNAFFTHYTAMRFHNLTLQIPKVIYLNQEQSPKPRIVVSISQSAIDKAFSSEQRTPSNYYDYHDQRIYLLQGAHTNRLGVIEIDNYHTTDLERTLIDITVRPAYSGGVTDVLAAFRLAKDVVDTDKLATYLKRMKFIYPYNQAIGFYMDKADYNEQSLASFEKIEMKYKFYLTYNIKRPQYSERWKIHFPTGL
jgi:predicted transcriptional regulator of viral defense system